ncbi:hypothetical protein PR048_016166 [Dryococelus australis]|uniref:Recombination activating protein 1 n=1 Tax=Dryococelus australis TaxID=614101 RepID=A0ABQ9HJ00_9NEOP|nr:hypothetical protein PR048_016166 [Dryococelus australis]
MWCVEQDTAASSPDTNVSDICDRLEEVTGEVNKAIVTAYLRSKSRVKRKQQDEWTCLECNGKRLPEQWQYHHSVCNFCSKPGHLGRLPFLKGKDLLRENIISRLTCGHKYIQTTLSSGTNITEIETCATGLATREIPDVRLLGS